MFNRFIFITAALLSFRGVAHASVPDTVVDTIPDTVPVTEQPTTTVEITTSSSPAQSTVPVSTIGEIPGPATVATTAAPATTAVTTTVPSDGELPRTGVNNGLVFLAVIVLGGGGFLLLVRRPRHW